MKYTKQAKQTGLQLWTRAMVKVQNEEVLEDKVSKGAKIRNQYNQVPLLKMFSNNICMPALSARNSY